MRRYQPLMGTTLFLEYEAIMAREMLFAACHLTREERETLLDAFLSVCRWQKVYYAWRPNLPDEADNHLVELAIAGGPLLLGPTILGSLSEPNGISSAYGSSSPERLCQRGREMATLTIRLPDDKHARLRQLAQQRKISLNKLMEELATIALAEFDAETRFRARAARGSVAEGLRMLDKLDAADEASGS
jgi:predicted transcriptional regulator